MLLNAFKLGFGCLLLAGCSYRLGEPTQTNWEQPIHLEVFDNETLYPELTQNLRRHLIQVIRGEQGPSLGQKEKGAIPLGGTLKVVEKKVLEQDSFGYPTELQFILSFELNWKGITRTVSNNDVRFSSSLFRPYDARQRPDDSGRALSEKEALQEAIEDLAQVIVLEIRRPKKG